MKTQIKRDLQYIPKITNEDLSDYLNDCLNGLKRSYLLQTALSIGVFDCMDVPKTGKDACEELEIDPLIGIIFLDALASMGLLEYKDSYYTNSELSTNFLTKLSPMPQHGNIGFIFRNLRHWENLEKILHNGQPLVKVSDIFTEEKTCEMMENCRGGSVGMILDLLNDRLDMNTIGTFLSIGAGGTLYTIAASQRWPWISGTIIDRECFIKPGEALIREYGTNTKMISGDYKYSLPGKFDLIFSSLTHACLETNIAESISQGLSKGGHLVVRRYLPEISMDPLRDLDINLTRLDVIPKGVRHHHDDENGRLYIRSMQKNGVYLIDRFDYDSRTEILIFERC